MNTRYTVILEGEVWDVEDCHDGLLTKNRVTIKIRKFVKGMYRYKNVEVDGKTIYVVLE